MNGKQQLIATLGVFLIGLTVWFEWQSEIRAILFNAPPSVGNDWVPDPSSSNDPTGGGVGPVGPLGPVHPPTTGAH